MQKNQVIMIATQPTDENSNWRRPKCVAQKTIKDILRLMIFKVQHLSEKYFRRFLLCWTLCHIFVVSSIFLF